MKNPDIARGKHIIEKVCTLPNRDAKGAPYNRCSMKNCPEFDSCRKVHNPDEGAFALTDGNTADYDEFTGYVSICAPGTLTLDLEAVHAVSTIQFLLWDNCGFQKTENCNRKYLYRLLTSEDGHVWHVLFDTFREGYSGWQRFDLSQPLKMRYIRFHALTINEKTPPPFLIVAMEAYEKPLKSYDYRMLPTLHVKVNTASDEPLQPDEAADPKTGERTLSGFFGIIVDTLNRDSEHLKNRGSIRLRKHIDDLIQLLKAVKDDAWTYEKGVSKIINRILEEPNKEFRTLRKLDRWNYAAIVLSGLCIVLQLGEWLYGWWFR